MTTTVAVNTTIETSPSGPTGYTSLGPIKDLAFYLPLGFLGDPTAAGKCTELQLIAQGQEIQTECPANSRIGNAVVLSNTVSSSLDRSGAAFVSPIYNMVPEAGFPAQFGFKVFDFGTPIYASVVHTPYGYALRAATPSLPRAIPVQGAQLTLFGDPNTADGNPVGAKAFFTNPTNCQSGPLNSRVETDSWALPGAWSSKEILSYPQVTGCSLLQFEPAIAVNPEVTQAEAPTGLEVKIKVPQAPASFSVLATPQLKNVTMTLPPGMTLSPGAGDGLAACAAAGEHGIDFPTNLPNGAQRTPTEVGEGEAIGPDGMSHLTPGHCPPASQVGTVEIKTPLLETPLEGRVYVAEPQCGGPAQHECTAQDAVDGQLFGLYLEAEGSGVVIKLPGVVSVDPNTGRITARFTENPQFPLSEVTLHLKGGGRAPLTNPRQCGQALAVADLAPWSSPVTPDALPTSAYTVDADNNGTPCPSGWPFTPTLAAGVTSAAAGRFTSFVFTIYRGDRQQDVARVQSTLPPGLLGMLSKVKLCEEAQANAGTCGAESRIGSVLARAGSGPQPLGVQGTAYLTGPYEGAPFGLSIVVPAVAGPFNLGNVIVRARVDIDPNTSAVTITSDPLPQVKDGVPLHLQMINVTADREGFFFNPTNCAIKQIEAKVESTEGALAKLTSPIAAEGCNRLPFKPTFKASTEHSVSKAEGASLGVKVTSAAGQANIAKAAVSLPKQLPARLTTLQHACLAEVFASNPAACDPRSLVGVVKATTPVLPVPLMGPVYLVSHGGAAFPDLVIVLQGDGVRVDLTGNTNIKKGITSSSFASVPDAPIGSFQLQLPRGPHSVLTSTVKSLCGQKLIMPTTLTGQSGVQVKQSTQIAVSGCPKKPPKRRAKRARR